jgi:uncharacterized membrane protein
VDEVVTHVEIAAPVEAVWDACMDPELLPEWVTILVRMRGHSSGPLRKGYEMEQRLCLRGVPFNVSWELVQYDAPEVAVWHGKAPARARAETEYRLSAIDGGTRFDYRNAFRPPLGPLGGLVGGALVGGLPQREADASLAKLKALVEARVRAGA